LDISDDDKFLIEEVNLLSSEMIVFLSSIKLKGELDGTRLAEMGSQALNI
jgi:hypothetical protein